MKNIIAIIYILLLLLLYSKSYSQYIPHVDSMGQHLHWSLKDKINKSDIVVEGVVINDTRADGFLGSKGNVFTSVIIRVSKVFKGEIKDTIIELVIEGGTRPSGQFKGYQTGSMGGYIGKDYEGLFFLRTNNSTIQSRKNVQSYFLLYFNSYIVYDSYKWVHTAAVDGKSTEDFEKDIYKPIEAITGTPRKVIGLMPFEEAAEKQQK
jgi:hypothetical protein